MKLQIERVAVVSTAHLSRAEIDRADQLREEAWPSVAYHTPSYGYVVWVGSDMDSLLSSMECGHRDPADYPGLLAVAMACHAQGLTWVRFDVDADKVSGLPVFPYELDASGDEDEECIAGGTPDCTCEDAE